MGKAESRAAGSRAGRVSVCLLGLNCEPRATCCKPQLLLIICGPQVRAAVAYVRAKLEERGWHQRVDHPDLMVLWHRYPHELKEYSEWNVFLNCFPRNLLVDDAAFRKVSLYALYSNLSQWTLF